MVKQGKSPGDWGDLAENLADVIGSIFWQAHVAEIRAICLPHVPPFSEEWTARYAENPHTAYQDLHRQVVNYIHSLWWSRGGWTLKGEVPAGFERFLNTVWAYLNSADVTRIAPDLGRLSRLDSAHAFATIQASDFPRDDNELVIVPAAADPVKAGRLWWDKFWREHRILPKNRAIDEQLTYERLIRFLLDTMPRGAGRPHGS